MPRRILLLITDLQIGGTPAVVRELAIRLREPGHVEVEVACLSGWGPVVDQLRDAGVQVTALAASSAADFPKTLLRLVDAPGAMAKPFALPPGVDAGRVAVMRAALAATYKDPTFLEEAAAMNLEFQPKDADQIQAILKEVLATPPEMAAKYRQIIQP